MSDREGENTWLAIKRVVPGSKAWDKSGKSSTAVCMESGNMPVTLTFPRVPVGSRDGRTELRTPSWEGEREVKGGDSYMVLKIHSRRMKGNECKMGATEDPV